MVITTAFKTTYAPKYSPIYLQIFNMTTLNWDTIAYNDFGDDNTEYELKGRVYTNAENYYDTADDNQITVRVWQLNDE